MANNLTFEQLQETVERIDRFSKRKSAKEVGPNSEEIQDNWVKLRKRMAGIR